MTAGVSITTFPAGVSAPYCVWVGAFVVLAALVIGPVLLLVDEPLFDAVFEPDAEESEGLADPLELGAAVRLAAVVGEGEDSGAADESDGC